MSNSATHNKQSFWTNVKQYGDSILYLGYDENGNRVKDKVKFQPTLFVTDNGQGQASDLICYDGKPVARVDFESIKAAKVFIKDYKDVSNFQIYGIDKFAYEYIARNFKNEINYSTALIRVFYIDIETMSDQGMPDPWLADVAITAITIYDSKTQKFYTWGTKEYDVKKTYPDDPIAHLRDNIIYKKFANETDMLSDFIFFWKKNFPDIVTGWYSRGFDIPFILNRIKNIFGEKVMNSLSPWGIIQTKTSNISRFGVTSEEPYFEIYGISELDLMDLCKKYGGENEENFKLKYIAQKHLGFTKIEYEGSLHELYMKDPQKYIDYNIQDVNCIVGLDKKKKFLNLIIEISYLGKVATFNDSLGSIKYWEIYAYNDLLDQGQVTEIKEVSAKKDEKYEGAYVADVDAGLHKWVVGFDFDSLYPRTIQQTNIGPETLVDIRTLPQELKDLLEQVTVDALVNKKLDLSLLKKYNYSLSGNAKLYRRDKISFFSKIMGRLFDRRKSYKRQMLDAQKQYEATKDEQYKELAEMLDIKQHALKILINGLYGNFGNCFFQYYSIPNAEGVTLTGQVTIKTTEKAINGYLNAVLKTDKINRIIAMDTDSAYLDLSDLVTAVFGEDQSDTKKIVDFLDAFAKEKLTPMLKRTCQELCDYLNGVENFMNMKREKIADTAIWTGKKRYLLNVWDNEGVRYRKPELDITGIQSVSSATPGVCRVALEEALRMLVQEKEIDLQRYVEKFKAEFMKMEPHLVAFPRGVGDKDSYEVEVESLDEEISTTSKKGAGVQMKATINYNNLLEKNGLQKRHEFIKNDSKIKFVYLKHPNIIHEDVIAFVDKLPKEFGLHEYVDYTTQFEKSFAVPLRKISDLIGWKLEEEWSLDS